MQVTVGRESGRPARHRPSEAGDSFGYINTSNLRALHELGHHSSKLLRLSDCGYDIS